MSLSKEEIFKEHKKRVKKYYSNFFFSIFLSFILVNYSMSFFSEKFQHNLNLGMTVFTGFIVVLAVIFYFLFQYRCPSCEKRVNIHMQKIKFCKKCGVQLSE